MELHGLAAAAAILVVASAGCASVVSGRSADVTINSYPQKAYVVVHDSEGQQVASAVTPAVVPLKRARSWFHPAKYTATISKPGFQTAQVPINSKVNPWVAGNLAVGLLGIGVDAATGAAWKPNPGEIATTLTPVGADGQTQLTSAEVPVGEEYATRMATQPSANGITR